MSAGKPQRGTPERDDLLDWYLIGAVALLSSLVIWLPLLTRGYF
jgi:hypothetical protein